MKYLIGLILLCYLLGCTFSIIAGAMGKNWMCLRQPSRIEALFPTYKLSCYLFGESGKPYYYEDKK